MSKSGFLQFEAGRASFHPANQSNLKSIQKALIGWKKPTLNKQIKAAFVLIM